MSPSHWLVPGPLHATLLALVLVLVVHARRSRTPSWLRRTSWLILAWMWIGATPAIGNGLVRALEVRHPALDRSGLLPSPHARVVVLASGQQFRPDGTPAPELDADGWERLLAGIALWRRVGGELILSGGPGHGPDDALAQRMRRIALEAGVPDAAIRPVGGGRNTRDDLANVAAQIQGRPPSPSAPVYLVTSAMHMPRAMGTARAMGLQALPAPCGFRHLAAPTWRAWLPDNGDPTLWRDGLHEWIGLAVYRWRGWLR
jgi:uncharacterized SAM-binding protein YcdF (DUF218 family)